VNEADYYNQLIGLAVWIDSQPSLAPFLDEATAAYQAFAEYRVRHEPETMAETLQRLENLRTAAIWGASEAVQAIVLELNERAAALKWVQTPEPILADLGWVIPAVIVAFLWFRFK